MTSISSSSKQATADYTVWMSSVRKERYARLTMGKSKRHNFLEEHLVEVRILKVDRSGASVRKAIKFLLNERMKVRGVLCHLMLMRKV